MVAELIVRVVFLIPGNLLWCCFVVLLSLLHYLNYNNVVSKCNVVLAKYDALIFFI